MIAEIISPGTELLMGQITDTNAAYLSARLPALGINLYFRSTAGDNPARIGECLRTALRRSDLVFTIGGLGPTPDDLTKETIAETLGEELVFDPAAAERLKDYFRRIGRPMADNNLKQAMVPARGAALYNPAGTAPGCAFRGRFEGAEKCVIAMPGPPSEFRAMWEESVKPYILAGFPAAVPLSSAMLRIWGIGESAVAQMLGDLTGSADPSFATYVGKGDVLVRITSPDPEKLREGVGKARSIFGESLYSEDGADMAQTAVRLAREKGVLVTAAESCTGGLVSKLITDIPGSSEIFPGGVVSYSNAVKRSLLGVDAGVLETRGAVSPETAAAMALGVRDLMGADIAVSLTGIAGPGGGTPQKPVGLVYMGVADGAGVRTEELRFAGTRENVRLRSAMAALNAVRLILIRR